MKKIILSFATFISFFSLSLGFEANVKVGYDFFRHSTGITTNGEKTTTGYKEFERGFVIGVELLPITFKDERIKLGVGLEYNFGETSYKYYSKSINGYPVLKKISIYDYPSATDTIMIPVYATVKFTYYRPKDIDLNLYTFARLGYAFSREDYYEFNGLYYGLGFGIDYKYFLAEILYDGKHKDIRCNRCEVEPASRRSKTQYLYYFHHKVGVRIGVQLGTQHFKKAQIEHKYSLKEDNE